MVYQTVSGKGYVDGKNMTMFYEGQIIGNYDCEPPDLVVDKNGWFIDTKFYINSRLFTTTLKSTKKNSLEFAEVICDFSCDAWNCEKEANLGDKRFKSLDKNKIFCDRFLFRETEPSWEWDTAEYDEERLRNEYEGRRDILEKLCKSKSNDCRLTLLDTRDIKIRDEENTRFIEFCWFCSCFNLSIPKTTLRENDLKKAKKYIKDYEKYDLLRNIDQTKVKPQFKGIGQASGYIADLTITSNADEPITISIKSSGLEGLLLLNPNKDEQNLVITGVLGIRINKTTYKPVNNVTLKPNESVTLPIEGYCANFDKKNPSEGIELILNGPTAPEPYNPSSVLFELPTAPEPYNPNGCPAYAVVDVLENITFPENFTSEDVVAIKQITIWMSQPENENKTSEDYEKRGYPIKKEYKQIIKDVLNQTGTNPDEVVALTGKKKGEISREPEKPSEEFPWIYVVAAIAGILAIVGIYKILKK
ncbi:hypothetical protein MSIBF_A510007 [groundwater metagenome]|uniref:Uncharacterized protein n=1 Tax=groundwater metagenome TaxID=717931 RepID=A0A098ECU0_9ZZZZ